MPDSNPSRSVKSLTDSSMEITPLSDALWKARLHFASTQISDQDMLIRLREAKQKIAESYSVPLELLEFREVLDKEQTYSGVCAHVTIGRIQAGKGKTVVHLKPWQSPGGELFSDMIAEIDFYYLDEFDQIVTPDRLLSALDKSSICRDLLNMDSLQEALNRVHERRSFVTKLEIARGRFPDRGMDAELEFTFHNEPGAALDLTEYRNSRKVKAGDILCQKVPPRDGKSPGLNVRGETILPRKGLDIQLIAGDGAKLSLDGTRITALRDGQAVMTRFVRKIYTTAGKKVVPARIEISVNELLTIRSSDKPINLSVHDSVEIIGNVKAGSTIVSHGEVFLEGNVEPGAQVHGDANVVVSGNIQGAQIGSNSSVFGGKGAQEATISARDTIKLNGTAENSELIARCVEILESLGSNIVASYKVQMERAGNDSAGRKTTITTGRKNFYVKQLKANQEAISTLATSLERIQEFFGKETLQRAEHDNLQRLMFDQLETLRQRGYKNLDSSKVESIKKLLEAVKPMRSVLQEKSAEIANLQQKANESDAEKPIILIREKIQDPIEVILDDNINTLGPSQTGVAISENEQGGLTARLYTATEAKEESEQASDREVKSD